MISSSENLSKTVLANYSSSVNTFKQNTIKDAQPLLKAHQKCRDLWEALQLADYKKQGILNLDALKTFFSLQSKNILELLQIKTPEELLELLDEHSSGFVNEDQQILMFSIIKERMQVCAYELNKVQEYEMSKKLIESVKILEKNIIEYQNILRKKNSEKQLKTYKEIGIEKKIFFENFWKQEFLNFSKNCEKKFEKLRENHEKSLKNLKKLQNPK